MTDFNMESQTFNANNIADDDSGLGMDFEEYIEESVSKLQDLTIRQSLLMMQLQCSKDDKNTNFNYLGCIVFPLYCIKFLFNIVHVCILK